MYDVFVCCFFCFFVVVFFPSLIEDLVKLFPSDAIACGN